MNIFRSPNGNSVLFIAEVGGNHEGNFDYAKRLLDLALDSGADFVKLQLYSASGLVSPTEDPNRHEHFKKFELTKEQYIELANHCNSRKPGSFMASVWQESMFDWYNELTTIHKIGSGDLTNHPLIKKMVLTKKPIILSTGLSTLNQIEQTVSFIKSIDKSYISEKKLAILQCTSSYPTPENEVNLNSMNTIKQTLSLPVGYSDHTEDELAVETAVAMGAEIIEKHFTDVREGKIFRDHKVSITCDELKKLLIKLKRIKNLQGNHVKLPTKSEIDQKHTISFRKSVYANKDLNAGVILTEEDVTTLRPFTGICASNFYMTIGKRINKALKKNDVIKDEHLS